MAKPGDEYQEIVGAVQRALDPGSQVEVGVWVEGPDGRRDMDVAVRGVRDGKPHLTLVECKDWRVPVGIAVIDALDSKRHDLDASAAVVFSNSGFTEDAERKAARVGISLAAALKTGDRRVRVQICKEFIARRQSVDRWSLIVFPESSGEACDSYSPYDVTWNGISLVNWISGESQKLLRECPGLDDRFEITAEYGFARGAAFQVRDHSVLLKGIALRLECSGGFAWQTVREDVSLGSYDFLKGRVIVPNRQSYTLGPFDNAACEDCAIAPDDSDLGPGTFRLDVTLLRPVAPLAGVAVAALDDIIAERAVRFTRSA